MTNTLEIFKGAFAGILGFGIQLTSADVLVKVGVGILTMLYLGLKSAEIIRDWKKPKTLSDSKPTTKD